MPRTPEPVYPQVARELAAYCVNNTVLYQQMTLPILADLRDKIKRKIYRAEFALPSWRNLATAGAKRYATEYCDEGVDGLRIFNKPTRIEAAKQLADYYEEQLRDSL